MKLSIIVLIIFTYACIPNAVKSRNESGFINDSSHNEPVEVSFSNHNEDTTLSKLVARLNHCLGIDHQFKSSEVKSHESIILKEGKIYIVKIEPIEIIERLGGSSVYNWIIHETSQNFKIFYVSAVYLEDFFKLSSSGERIVWESYSSPAGITELYVFEILKGNLYRSEKILETEYSGSEQRIDLDSKEALITTFKGEKVIKNLNKLDWIVCNE